MSIESSFNRNAQFAHFGMAATIFLTIGHYSHPWALYLLPVGIALAAWKEFYWDKKEEDPEERGSDTEDFLFYLAGIAYALGVLFI